MGRTIYWAMYFVKLLKIDGFGGCCLCWKGSSPENLALKLYIIIVFMLEKRWCMLSVRWNM